MTDTSTKIRVTEAEQLLFELARELRFVPIEPRTMKAHLRALELKREVRGWSERAPREEAMKAVLEEIRRLSEEAGRLRVEVPTGSSLARIASPTSSSVGRRFGGSACSTRKLGESALSRPRFSHELTATMRSFEELGGRGVSSRRDDGGRGEETNRAV